MGHTQLHTISTLHYTHTCTIDAAYIYGHGQI